MYSQLLISDFCHQIFSKSNILFSHSAGDWTQNLLHATLALSCISKKEVFAKKGHIWVTDAAEYQWTNTNNNLQRRKRGSINEGTNAHLYLVHQLIWAQPIRHLSWTPANCLSGNSVHSPFTHRVWRQQHSLLPRALCGVCSLSSPMNFLFWSCYHGTLS